MSTDTTPANDPLSQEDLDSAAAFLADGDVGESATSDEDNFASASTVSEPSPGESPATGEPSPQETAAADDGNERLVMEYYRDVTGRDVSSKYQSDAEFFRSITELERALGQRNEDAMRWREFQTNPQAFLQQYGYASPPPPAPVPQQTASTGDASTQQIASFKEYQRLRNMVQVNPETEKLEPKPGAPLDAVERLQEHTQKMQEVVFTLAQNPMAFIGQHVAELAQSQIYPQVQQMVQQTILQQSQQQANEQRIKTEAGQWVAGHVADLCVDGDANKGLSPFGQLVERTFQERYLPRVNAGAMTYAEAMECACAQAKAATPQPRPVQPPSPHARPRPNVANTNPQQNLYEMKKGESVDRWLERSAANGLFEALGIPTG